MPRSPCATDEYNTYRSVHALLGGAPGVLAVKTCLKLSVSADRSANEILDDRTSYLYPLAKRVNVISAAYAEPNNARRILGTPL